MVTIEIDGQQIEAEEGKMIIDVADAAGITIPRFCYHDKLSVAANCRMCLVEVEKAPKPMPACATPVADGMKVMTRSALARDAQKGTMEFLLINHPLDCPICDQGGECDLQDLALGYGKDISRYQEMKRIVKDKNIGPLIATDMTRCIHCTRCVRFGKEIAGIMELGAIGRGEHTLITTFLEGSVNSELSGNVIDLCPVGALTSKPFRYSARPWELMNHDSISPHDAVGSNLTVQTLRNKVMRVLPRNNESINECWIADRDRFSYEAVNSDERLRLPMIRVNGQWQETDWPTALSQAANGMRQVIEKYGPDQIGAIAAPNSTLEEFYLLQKLMRGLGSNNIDHRVRQVDFSDDDVLPSFPWLGQAITDLEQAEAVLLIGSNVCKDQPMIGHRLRKARQRGTALMAINSIDYDFKMGLSHNVVTNPIDLLRALGGVAKSLGVSRRAKAPETLKDWLADITPGPEEKAIANVLKDKARATILLGNSANHHSHAAAIRILATLIAEASGAVLGVMPEANSVGAWIAGCVPHRGPGGETVTGGQHLRTMLSNPLKAYVLFGVEPELDCLDGSRARTAMQTAEYVVMMSAFKPSPFKSDFVDYADVLLPITPFTETDGTFVNMEGRAQEFQAVVNPLGESRPGWKILRVLANQLAIDGFDYNTIADIRQEARTELIPEQTLKELRFPQQPEAKTVDLIRIAETPMYAIDVLVRRAPALQQTLDNPRPAAHMNATEADKLGMNDGDLITVRMTEGNTSLPLVVDARIPDGSVYIPAGYAETSSLGAHGPISVRRG